MVTSIATLMLASCSSSGSSSSSNSSTVENNTHPTAEDSMVVAVDTVAPTDSESYLGTHQESDRKWTVPYPYKLREHLDLRESLGTVRDRYEPIALTDSLRQRIRTFVEHDANYIVYTMGRVRDKDLPYELDLIMDDAYIFSADDKEVLYQYLCKNTGAYNFLGSHIRMERYRSYHGKWPY